MGWSELHQRRFEDNVLSLDTDIKFNRSLQK